MSETETTVPMDDKTLFDAAISDTPADPPAPEAAVEQAADDGQKHDPETGRFLPKEAKAEEEVKPEPVTAKAAESQPVVQAPAKQEPPPGWIPAWRVREIADARAREVENKYRKAEPTEPIDPYIDPEKFADQRAKQAVDPVTQQMAETREYYSRKDAIRTHGQETVQAAYDWLSQADQSGDPRAQAFIARVKQAIDPFEEIVTAFKRDKALATVGDDPNAYFEKELERRKSDPEFMTKHGMQPAQPAQGAAPTNIVRLPPSLNRQPGSAGNESTATLDDKSLYEHAIR